MATLRSLLLYYISSTLLVTFIIYCAAANAEERKVYIVYMGSLPEGQYSPSSHHLTILQEVIQGRSASEVLVRSYKRSFNGFAAKLTDQEREKLASMEGVVSVFPSRVLQLQTTRSWDFIGLVETVKRKPTVESDIIIGVFDTGIWPESESFSDEGFGPPPKKWKGSCEGGSNFTCNNKIIGARIYSKTREDSSARDTQGHGSHTASTAAGNKVTNVSFYGLAKGSARGGVPSSRIATYMVCPSAESGCTEEGILAAFDDAIADGVDVITISIGGMIAFDFDSDSIAIGSFHAMKNGILTSNSAGNSGPDPASTASVAPWMLSVAASTIDRRFVDSAVLADGTTLVGISVNPFNEKKTKVPLIYGSEASSSCDEIDARICAAECLDEDLVKGKIVLCESFKGINEAFRAGAVGSIVAPEESSDLAFSVPLPATRLSIDDGAMVKSYHNSTSKPHAEILKSETIKDSAAPVVASFSSRGPSTIAPDILKPDITAPGVNILAAFSPVTSPSISPQDTRSVKYSILSGTSMSCPHAAGAAAYVKTFQPDWSPSAIKSALMTTAWTMSDTTNPQEEFAYGAGHIDPVKAKDPGLVYEALEGDYIKMLCNIGYSTKRIKIISGDNNSSCPKKVQGSARDLNYPSMAAQVEAFKSFTTNFSRTVTNVGLANSTYKAKIITSDSHIDIGVEPKVLSFGSLNEKQSFIVTATGNLSAYSIVSAALVWDDGTHRVRSPIVLYTDHGPLTS